MRKRRVFYVVIRAPSVSGMIGAIKTYGSFVKFSHTVFALPFAITGMLAALATPSVRGQLQGPGPLDKFPWPLAEHPGIASLGSWLPRAPGDAFSAKPILFIVLAMVGARTFAMAINRLVDRRIDALNPRTAKRELPAGKLSLSQAWVLAGFAGVLYFGACAMLGPVTTALSPIPIALMTVYPFTKRFTSLCHFVLGASLGLAPVGAWVAVRAGADHRILGWNAVTEPLPWLLGAGVMLWVAGFDIIYALQDDEFDRTNKLHSLPADYGRSQALLMARVAHAAAAILFMIFAGFVAGHWRAAPHGHKFFPSWTMAAPVVAVLGIIWQHRLVKADDLSRVNMAFFTVNGIISVLFGAVYVAGYIVWALAH